MNPLLLVVSTGSRPYREYLMRSIAPQYRIHLFLTAEPTWEREYIDGWTVLESTLDADVLVRAAKDLDARDHIDGVLCWDEARILPTAAVGAALGLPGGDVAVIERCRDKHLTREAFARAGVPQPRSILVADVSDALSAAAAIGYPVVLKPRALAASLGVILVPDAQGIRDHFAFARDTTVPEAPHYDASVLVEEYADGPEISIDCAVHDGRVYPICLAHKEIGWAPYFEEVGHVVHGDDQLLRDAPLRAILDTAHVALGFTDGVTHTELRMTSRGPRVIEVNGRLGGDLIPYLGLLAAGVDPGLAAAAVACGREPDVGPTRSDVAAVRFHYVEQEMTIGSVSFDEAALPDGIDQAVVLTEPGEHVLPPPDGTLWGRIAFVTTVGSTVQHATSVLDCAQAALRVTAAES